MKDEIREGLKVGGPVSLLLISGSLLFLPFSFSFSFLKLIVSDGKRSMAYFPFPRWRDQNLGCKSGFSSPHRRLFPSVTKVFRNGLNFQIMKSAHWTIVIYLAFSEDWVSA